MKDPIPNPKPKKAKDTLSFVEGLKTEWNLFWETILGEVEAGDEQESEDAFITGKLEQLSLEQVKSITKALSLDRKKLHQKLESLNKELESSSTRLESLALVSGNPEDSQSKISELNELGLKLSEELNKINDRLKLARRREDQLKKAQRKVDLE